MSDLISVLAHLRRNPDVLSLWQRSSAILLAVIRVGGQKMEMSARPLINPSVIERQALDGEAVLVNMDTAAAVALNATGVVVWQLLDGRRSVEQIIAAVEHHFKDVPDSVAKDVADLLDTLAEDAFIGFEWIPSAPAQRGQE